MNCATTGDTLETQRLHGGVVCYTKPAASNATMLVRPMNRPAALSLLGSLLLFSALLFVSPAVQARYSVSSPYVTAGKTEAAVEVKAYRNDPDDDKGVTEYKAKIEHGFTSFWASELEYEHKRKGHGDWDNKVKWNNKFQLTPKGKYWLDVGFHLEGEFPTKSSRPNEVEFGPIFAKSFGATTAMVNLYFTREFGSHAGNNTEFAYKAQLRYHLSRYFDPALEAFGGPGNVGDFLPKNEQRHQLGPGFYGEVPMGSGGGKIKYNAAALRGLTGAGSPDWTYVAKVEYKFAF